LQTPTGEPPGQHPDRRATNRKETGLLRDWQEVSDTPDPPAVPANKNLKNVLESPRYGPEQR
jgi:hypothetical protein